MLASLLEIPGPPVELAETEMAVGGERAQAQLLGEGQGLTIVRLRRIDLEALREPAALIAVRGLHRDLLGRIRSNVVVVLGPCHDWYQPPLVDADSAGFLRECDDQFQPRQRLTSANTPTTTIYGCSTRAAMGSSSCTVTVTALRDMHVLQTTPARWRLCKTSISMRWWPS